MNSKVDDDSAGKWLPLKCYMISC